MPLRILDLYIARNFLVTFFFLVLLVTIIIVVVDVAEKIDDFTEKQLALELIVREYYANFLPYILNRLAPILIFLTVVFFTAQMTQRTEVVAILASGISFYRFLLPYLVVACMLGAGLYFLNANVVPKAFRGQLAFASKYLERRNQVEVRNVHKKVDRNTLFYVSTYNLLTNAGYLATLETYNDSNRLIRRLDAQTIEWRDSTKQWRLLTVRERVFAEPTREELSFRAKLDTTLLLEPGDFTKQENAAQTLTQRELENFINLERERGSDFLPALYRVRHERAAYSLAAIILTFMGVALSSKKRRGGISLQLGLGLLLCFVYVLVINTVPLLLADRAPIWVSIWMPNLLFLGVAGLLVRLAPK